MLKIPGVLFVTKLMWQYLIRRILKFGVIRLFVGIVESVEQKFYQELLKKESIRASHRLSQYFSADTPANSLL